MIQVVQAKCRIQRLALLQAIGTVSFNMPRNPALKAQTEVEHKPGNSSVAK
jgi:hypothetical protein